MECGLTLNQRVPGSSPGALDIKTCEHEGRFCGHFSRVAVADFRSLCSDIVFRFLLARQSPASEIPFPGACKARCLNGAGTNYFCPPRSPTVTPTIARPCPALARTGRTDQRTRHAALAPKVSNHDVMSGWVADAVNSNMAPRRTFALAHRRPGCVTPRSGLQSIVKTMRKRALPAIIFA